MRLWLDSRRLPHPCRRTGPSRFMDGCSVRFESQHWICPHQKLDQPPMRRQAGALISTNPTQKLAPRCSFHRKIKPCLVVQQYISNVLLRSSPTRTSKCPYTSGLSCSAIVYHLTWTPICSWTHLLDRIFVNQAKLGNFTRLRTTAT